MSKAIQRFLLIAALFQALTVAAFGQISNKIGFVHFRDALGLTAEGKAEIAQVQAFVDAKNTEMNGYIDEANQLREDIQTRGRSLNAETLSGMRSQLQQKETALQRFQEDTQKEIDERRDNIFRKVGPRLQVVINEFAAQNGFDVVYLLDQAQYGYVDATLDLTDRIAAAFDQKHPVGAAPSSGPAS